MSKTLEINNIIKQCLHKDRAAEKLLYFKYVNKVYGICRRYSIDDHQAEDYMQEGFAKVFKHLDRYDADKGQLEAWIIRIVVNTILSSKRYDNTNRKEEYIGLTDQMLMAVHDDQEAELRESNAKELLKAIRKLPIKYRDVLNLFVFENLSHKEIASLMSIEVSSSRSRLTRAKKMLRHILSNKIVAII